MRERGNFYPEEANLGKNCLFWSQEFGCIFPKKEMAGRTSCDGVVDDVCLRLKDDRIPKSLTTDQLLELRTRIPNDPLDIPPGDIEV